MLATIFEESFVPAQVEENATALMRESSFLPRLQVNGSMSTLVVAGKMRPGLLSLVWNDTKYKELGKEARCVAITFRNKAMVMPDGGNPISYFDIKSDDFKRVIAKANEGGMNGHMYGPEFLIWVPSENTFATFYCSNKTLQGVAPNILQAMKKEGGPAKPASILIATKFIEGKKHKWWGAECQADSTPLPAPEDPEVWTSMLHMTVSKFNNPPKSEVEVAPQETSSDRVR